MRKSEFGFDVLETDIKFSVDVLDTFPIIRVAVAYFTPEGEKLTSFPANLSLVSEWVILIQCCLLTHFLARQMHGRVHRLSWLANLH